MYLFECLLCDDIIQIIPWGYIMCFTGGLLYLLHSLVPLFFRPLPESGKLLGKKIRNSGIIYAELLRFTSKELTVQPCDLSRQLFDTFLQFFIPLRSTLSRRSLCSEFSCMPQPSSPGHAIPWDSCLIQHHTLVV